MKKSAFPKYSSFVLFSAAFILYFLFFILPASAFTGPSQNVGIGSGAIGVDAANNLSVGTSTPQADTKLLVVASSTSPGAYSLRVIQPNLGPILVIRNDGRVGVALNSPAYALDVSGDIQASGALFGTLAGTVPAEKIITGTFTNDGLPAPFSFASSLGVATSSQVGLPQALSVYGGGYFSGGVGIGTASPGAALHIVGGNIRLGNTDNRVEFGSTGAVRIQASNSGGNLDFAGGSIASNAYRFWSNNLGAVIATMNSSGQLRLGDGSAPGRTLDVIGNAYVSGDVGVGITVPGQKLEIAGNTSSTQFCLGGSCITAWPSGGITSLNGLTASSQSFATTTNTGPGINITSSGSTHTLSFSSSLIQLGGLSRTVGNLVVGGGTSWNALAVGTNGRVLTASSTAPNGVSWEPAAQTGVSGSGAATRVAFWDSASSISSNANLFWDNPNNRLGINTVTPAYALDVVGDIRASGSLIGTLAGTVPAEKIITGTFTNDGLPAPFSFASSLGVATSSQVGLPQELSVYGDTYVSGNIGVGTAAPGTKLEVVGGNIRLGDIDNRIEFGPAGAIRVQASNSGGNLDFAGGTGAQAYRFWTNNFGSIFATMNSTGLFLGGAITPLNRLGVSGAVAIGAYAGIAAPADGLVVSGNTGIGTASPSQKLEVVGNTSSTQFCVGGSCISSWPSGGLTGSGVATRVAFWDSASSISSNANLFWDNPNNRLGINTVTPAYALDVVGDIRASGSLIGTLAGTVPAEKIITGTFTNDGLPAPFSFASSLGVATSSQVGLPQELSVYGDGYFSGNLGVGAASPAYKLDVNGNVRFGGTADGVLNLQNSAGIVWTLNPSTGNLQVSASSPGVFFNVTGSINVGIGTTAPSQKLEVVGNTSSTQFCLGGSCIASWPSGSVTGSGVATRVAFWDSASSISSNANLFWDNTNSRLGIGTATPGNPLHVVGTGRFTGALTLDTQGTASGQAIHAGRAVNTGTGLTGGGELTADRTISLVTPVVVSSGGTGATSFTAGQILFGNGTAALNTNANLFWDNTNSRLGIGTGAPGNTLHVVGAGLFTGDVTLGDGVGSKDLIVGGGVGMIDAGGIDPVYTIGGKQYATYGLSMTGLKEETTGVVSVKCQVSSVKCSTAIDFANAEEGSDLWLFAKTTNLGENFDKLVALFTPSFDGRVWYEKDATAMTLTIFAQLLNPQSSILNSIEVSYRLTAPRFDYLKWTNFADGASQGFNLDEFYGR